MATRSLIDYFPRQFGMEEGSVSKYIIVERIGKGTFGEVYTVKLRADVREKRAVKLMSLKDMSPNATLRARSEVANLKALDFFACVRFEEDFLEDQVLAIVMEYCDAGDLCYQLRSMKKRNNNVPQGFAERDVRLILLQLMLALNHMHGTAKMLHRDIKAANVLLSTTGIVKLGDFGLSRTCEETNITNDVAQTFCGTPEYLAPEVWRRERYGAKADVWSLGVLAYEVLCGCRPFGGGDNEELRRKVLSAEVPAFPDDVRPELRDIILSMLRKSPIERPGVKDLLRTEYMRGVLDRFPAIVKSTSRLKDDQRDFVFLGLEQSTQSISTSTPATNQVAFSGPVRKYKDGRFVERHLVLKDGLLDLRRDPERQSQEPKNIGEIEEVMMVPISEGSNVIENVFAITFAGERCHWFQSEQCKQWTEKIRLAMTVAAQWK